jgi:hypothetical protein
VWKDAVYPNGTQSRDYLPFPAQQYPIVEVFKANSTLRGRRLT